MVGMGREEDWMKKVLLLLDTISLSLIHTFSVDPPVLCLSPPSLTARG